MCVAHGAAHLWIIKTWYIFVGVDGFSHIACNSVYNFCLRSTWPPFSDEIKPIYRFWHRLLTPVYGERWQDFWDCYWRRIIVRCCVYFVSLLVSMVPFSTVHFVYFIYGPVLETVASASLSCQALISIFHIELCERLRLLPKHATILPSNDTIYINWCCIMY